MEDKKFDLNSILGFVFMGLILMWMFYNQSNKTKTEQLKKAQEQKIVDSIQQLNAVHTKVIDTTSTALAEPQTIDSLAKTELQNKLGAFAFGASQNAEIQKPIVLENEVIKMVFNPKGAKIESLLLKKFVTYQKKPLYIINQNNAANSLTFSTSDNRNLTSDELVFEPELSENNGFKTLSLKAKVAENQYLEYLYTLKPNDYLLDFNIKTIGLEKVLNVTKPMVYHWNLNSYHTEKSINYENMNTTLVYKHEKNEFNTVNATGKPKTKEPVDVEWFSYRQQFFSTILIAKQPLKGVKLTAENLVKNEKIDTLFTKKFTSEIPLTFQNGNINQQFSMYVGPSDYNILKTYKGLDLERTVDLGWGIFRWINKFVFIPIFNILQKFMLSYGWIIILMTIVVKILTSPLVYKSYLSSAKMKVLRPEMEEINAKFPGKDNAMKRQQEIMAIQSKAGVSMLSGCIPALLQMPIFFALFRFFPTNFALRQKSFLWADDLSGYDSIYKLPFNIPIYGNHIGLLPLLASIAIFFYMKMTQNQQANMQPPAQEGMPDMQQMMKIMLWISPVMMLFFFNQYGSGLSLYYFVTNVLTIGIMWVIMKFVVDEKKVHDMVRKKQAEAPKQKSAFRQKLDDAMKQAQEQQERQRKTKK